MIKDFVVDALVRAAKTAAQSLVALFTAANVLGLFDIDWRRALGVAGLAAVLSLLTSVAAFNLPALRDRSGTALKDSHEPFDTE
jgi:hypothetical protein